MFSNLLFMKHPHISAFLGVTGPLDTCNHVHAKFLEAHPSVVFPLQQLFHVTNSMQLQASKQSP